MMTYSIHSLNIDVKKFDAKLIGRAYFQVNYQERNLYKTKNIMVWSGIMANYLIVLHVVDQGPSPAEVH